MSTFHHACAKETSNKNGQTYEGSDQSDDKELAAVLEDLGNMAVVSACAAGGTAGGAAGGAAAGTAAGASQFPLIQHTGYYTFGNVFKTGGYLLKYNPISFKEKIMEDKILCVEGQRIHTASSNFTEMTELFSKF